MELLLRASLLEISDFIGILKEGAPLYQYYIGHGKPLVLNLGQPEPTRHKFSDISVINLMNQIGIYRAQSYSHSVLFLDRNIRIVFTFVKRSGAWYADCCLCLFSERHFTLYMAQNGPERHGSKHKLHIDGGARRGITEKNTNKYRRAAVRRSSALGIISLLKG